MSIENTVTAESYRQYFACGECHTKTNSIKDLTWVLSKEDIIISKEDDLEHWMKSRKGLPSVIVNTEDAEVNVYRVSAVCNDCLNRHIMKYEELHTPHGKLTRNDFHELVVGLSLDNNWTGHSLTNSHLAPRGFPNLVFTRDERIIFCRLQGDPKVRLRSFHPPAGTIVMSPEVPPEVREALMSISNKEQMPDGVAFLYMDEKYINEQAPPEMQVTSLTGLLITADIYPTLRDRLFRILPGFEEGAQISGIEPHASNLFRDRPDKEHFEFYSALVSLVNEIGCRVYRRGFRFIPGNRILRSNQQDLIGLCFRSMLIAADDNVDNVQIWPVMEIDRSEDQDQHFAGYMRWMDHASAHLRMAGDGVEELIDDDYMVDNRRLGDLHYVTKKSIVGGAVDCLVYLLHSKWLHEMGFELTDYKSRLADIASELDSSVVDDFVGTMRIEQRGLESEFIPTTGPPAP